MIILAVADETLHADQVFHVNGDRLTGTIMRLDKNYLVFSVEYSEKELSFVGDNSTVSTFGLSYEQDYR